MKIVSLIIVVIFCLIVTTAEKAEPKIYHGTLNLIFGNKHGVVAATDSCATETNNQGVVTRRTYNHQKLFQITKDIIVTIAGYNSAEVPAAEVFTAPATTLILQYIEELKAKNHVPTYREVIDSLSFIITFHLDAVTNINYITDVTPEVKDYEFHLVIAGKFQDRMIISKIILKPEIAPNKKYVKFGIVRKDSIEVKDKFVFETAGWKKKAEDILNYPSRYASLSAIKNYADQFNKDGGENLSTSDMRDIAKAIMDIASDDYEGIGGPTQIAIYDSKEFITSIPYFPPPKVNPIRFNYFVNMSINGGKYAIKSQFPGLIIASNFENTGVILDNLFYFGNTLRDCKIYVNSDRFTFHILNTVENCQLIIGKNVSLDSQAVKSLISNFHWKAIDKGVDLEF